MVQQKLSKLMTRGRFPFTRSDFFNSLAKVTALLPQSDFDVVPNLQIVAAGKMAAKSVRPGRAGTRLLGFRHLAATRIFAGNGVARPEREV